MLDPFKTKGSSEGTFLMKAQISVSK